MKEPHPEFYKAYFVWCNDGLSPLTVIQGYTDLLLRGYGGELSQEQIHAIEIMRQSTRKAMDVWRRGLAYLHATYEPADLKWESIVTLGDALHYLSREYDVDIQIPLSLTTAFDIFCDIRMLVLAIHYLVYPPEAIVTPDKQRQPRIYIQADEDIAQIWIRSIEIPFEGYSERAVMTPGSSFQIAQRILHEHGAAIQIGSVESEYDCQFHLRRR